MGAGQSKSTNYVLLINEFNGVKVRSSNIPYSIIFLLLPSLQKGSYPNKPYGADYEGARITFL